ncbi:hypothetical protein BDZ97DRAFT_1977088 [Flammula alnicola]|nr:hypothetical protein BDZ97DRAFT_1977088 [Flammula alnicola]
MNTLRGASCTSFISFWSEPRVTFLIDAGLTFLCWEILITLNDEVELMWTQPRRVTIVRVLYFFVRYFALAVQINNAVVSKILNDRYPVPWETCRMWLVYQATSIYLLLSAVDIILMIRVYAFYNRSRWIGLLMIFLLFCRVGLSTAGAILTVPGQEFNESCLNENVPSLVMYFFMRVFCCFLVEMGELIIQCTVLGLTFFKHVMAVRAGWGRTPLVSLLCKDGATAFTVLVGMYSSYNKRYKAEHVP